MRAASTGRYERLFWLVDRWPAVMEQASAACDGGGSVGEGVLHLACRAAADRCVELCLQREVGRPGHSVFSASSSYSSCIIVKHDRHRRALLLVLPNMIDTVGRVVIFEFLLSGSGTRFRCRFFGASSPSL